MERVVMKFKYRLQNWIVYWVDLICDIVRIVTFGFYYPNWDMEIRTVMYRYNIRKR